MTRSNLIAIILTASTLTLAVPGMASAETIGGGAALTSGETIGGGITSSETIGGGVTSNETIGGGITSASADGETIGGGFTAWLYGIFE